MNHQVATIFTVIRADQGFEVQESYTSKELAKKAIKDFASGYNCSSQEFHVIENVLVIDHTSSLWDDRK